MDEPREERLTPLPSNNGDQSPHSENAKRERIKRKTMDIKEEEMRRRETWRSQENKTLMTRGKVQECMSKSCTEENKQT